VSSYRHAAAVLSMTTLALVVVSAAFARTAAAPAPPDPLRNPVLYPGTLSAAPSCSSPKSCTSFQITFTNTDKVTFNSFLIQVPGNPFVSFELTGEPACQSTGGSFGPGFENDWICLGLNIAPGGTFTGGGVATQPLTAASTARFDESPTGSLSGLLPDYSQDIHFDPVAAAKPLPKTKRQLTRTQAWLESAIVQEEKALTLGDSPALNQRIQALAHNSRLDVINAGATLRQAGGDDEIAGAAEARIGLELKSVEADDLEAIHATDARTAKSWLTKALAKKQAALRLVEDALRD
jgi:hypothetical protein